MRPQHISIWSTSTLRIAQLQDLVQQQDQQDQQVQHQQDQQDLVIWKRLLQVLVPDRMCQNQKDNMWKRLLRVLVPEKWLLQVVSEKEHNSEHYAI